MTEDNESQINSDNDTDVSLMHPENDFNDLYRIEAEAIENKMYFG
jgi:hypothetical protein